MIVRRNFLALLSLLCFLGHPFDADAQILRNPDVAPEAPHRLKDQPADAYKIELLELAWDAATAYPVNPHIKNRARAEEQVVMGALGIDQPQLAWGLANKVVNWRRGMCYAEIAHYLINNEQRQHADYFLYMALEHGKDDKQAWRGARVKSRVAAARVLLGQDSAGRDLIEAQDGKAIGEQITAKAAVAGDEQFELLLNSLDRLVSSKQYEAMLAALQGYAELYRQNFSNKQRRDLLLERVANASETLPGINHFEAMIAFVKAARDHGDKQVMIELLDQTEQVFKSFNWRVDFYAPMIADMARYRAIAGQREQAQHLIDLGLVHAQENMEILGTFERAKLFRPYAEVYAVMGDQARAQAMYVKVVELGSVNPNLRPRVADITATCVSMALHGIEPDAKLLATIKQIVGGLTEE